jgi:hypothetical protein
MVENIVEASASQEVVTFLPDQFNKEQRNIGHTNLIDQLDRGLPGSDGIYGSREVGPSFLGFVYEKLKGGGQDTDYATIILTANLLVDGKSYPNFRTAPQGADKANAEYVGRIRRYLDALQHHIEKNPDKYPQDFMTKKWTDEELKAL